MTAAYERNKKWREKNPGKANDHRRKNRHKRREYRERNYSKTEHNTVNKGKPYSKKEDKLILSLNRPKGKVLSELLGRPAKTINKHRAKLIRKQKDRIERKKRRKEEKSVHK
jgi:hypothetical protein